MDMEKLKKDYETVMCWRKFGKNLNDEQQRFADKLYNEMASARISKQVGVQLISKAHLDFIKSGVVSKELLEKGMPRHTPDCASIKLDTPDNCKCGGVNAVADSKTDPKQLSEDDKSPIAIEEIGHQPNLPMPKKMGEELIANAKWGVELGVYGSLEEGIDRMLSNKEYAEFTDTSDKVASVKSYLTNMVGE